MLVCMDKKERNDLFKSRVKKRGEFAARELFKDSNLRPEKKQIVVECIQEFEQERLEREADLHDADINEAREANRIARNANIIAVAALAIAIPAAIIAIIAFLRP